MNSLTFVRLCCVKCHRERVVITFWADGAWCNHGATCPWGDNRPCDHSGLALPLELVSA